MSARHVNRNDKRTPMHRLLADCNNSASGMVEVDYEQQWRTLVKAQRLGYLDDHQRLTDAGKAFISARLCKQAP